MQKVGHIKQLPVDLKALMDGLSSLLLPSQKPAFSQHLYVTNIVLYLSKLVVKFVLHWISSLYQILFFSYMGNPFGYWCYVFAFICNQNRNFTVGWDFVVLVVSFSSMQVLCGRSCINVEEICRLPLSEDPALAMAFSVARRAAAVPLLLVNGTYRKSVRTYLDSSIVQHQLQRLNDHGSLKG